MSLTDKLPFGSLLTGAGSTQGTCEVSGRTVTCRLGLLPCGSSVTVTIAGVRKLEGMFTNAAVVTSDMGYANL